MKSLLIIMLCLLAYANAGDVNSNDVKDISKIRCGNLVYAGTKSSVCFANKFLSRVSTKTQIKVASTFKDVKLGSEDLFETPFCVFSGEGSFSLSKIEKSNVKKYLTNGGFILASPGCSNAEWDIAFKAMFKEIFPENKLQKIAMDHPIFNLIYKVKTLHLKSGGTTKLEGLFIDKRLVMVYSKEGLNDVKNAKGCCCCGGNEIKESQMVNVNILTYSLLH